MKIARKRRKRKVVIAASCLLAALVLAAGLFAWDRFFRFDDASDIQGHWAVEGQNMTVTIDAEQLNMPESLSYPYTLDTWAKTISYDFAGYSGGGSYEFARDRQSFTISEGEGEGATVMTFVRIDGDLEAEPQVSPAPAAPAEPAAPDASGEPPAPSAS